MLVITERSYSGWRKGTTQHQLELPLLRIDNFDVEIALLIPDAPLKQSSCARKRYKMIYS